MIITTAEAAQMLGLERNTVAQYIRRGLIKARKVHRDYEIDKADVEFFQMVRRPYNLRKPRRKQTEV